MKQRYPGDWAIEAFTFWVDYFWQHGKEPTYEQWKKHKARQQAYSQYKAKRVQASKHKGLEALKLLYRKVEGEQ